MLSLAVSATRASLEMFALRAQVDKGHQAPLTPATVCRRLKSLAFS
jgi:hypothetical protein